jgi:hypothetical protein
MMRGGNMKLRLLGIFLLINVLIIPLVYAEEEPQVEFFSPQGTVKSFRQGSRNGAIVIKLYPN